MTKQEAFDRAVIGLTMQGHGVPHDGLYDVNCACALGHARPYGGVDEHCIPIESPDPCVCEMIGSDYYAELIRRIHDDQTDFSWPAIKKRAEYAAKQMGVDTNVFYLCEAL